MLDGMMAQWDMRWYNDTMVQWLDGLMVRSTRMKTRTRMTMMTSFFDLTTYLVVGCIPVREGRGVFSMMIRTKKVRTRMTKNYNDHNK